jgi:hypothetical protein
MPGKRARRCLRRDAIRSARLIEVVLTECAYVERKRAVVHVKLGLSAESSLSAKIHNAADSCRHHFSMLIGGRRLHREEDHLPLLV